MGSGGMLSRITWVVEGCYHGLHGWWRDVITDYMGSGGMLSRITWVVEGCYHGLHG